MPELLFRASENEYQKLGYKNMQEFILDLVRRKVLIENIERYTDIENRMKSGAGVKKFSQKDAIKYVKTL